MKHAIFTVNVRGALDSNSRQSVADAAMRWDATLVECIENSNHLHPACWKTEAFEICEHVLQAPVERLLIIDADTVVSGACPNPFEIFPEHQMMVVSDRQTYNPARDKAETDEWEILTHERRVPAAYFNSGVIVATRERHLSLFHEAARLCRLFPHLCWHDQTPFNVAAFRAATDLHIVYADERWNFHNPAGRIPNWRNMGATDKYIYHFPGNPDRQQQIKQVTWKS